MTTKRRSPAARSQKRQVMTTMMMMTCKAYTVNSKSLQSQALFLPNHWL